MTIQIVVSRYNEDPLWTQLFPNVVLYNKGTPLGHPYTEIFLPNVGREAHTYYHHIYTNYDNLADYTVFLQGSPFHHSPNVINTLWKYLITPPTSGFEFVSEWLIESNLSGCPHHPELPMQEVYEKIFQEKKTELALKFGGGAQFIVSREAIRRRPREFYLRIVNLFDAMCTPEACVLERLHHFIFTT
jgi:hypothetical protein